ncbi:hypothetical protein J3R83DRAFT_5733 [Lanmaoa asiatica]|nr:hypothetical protein J3R83DRAFT_5733 [Lanmaoa asiatica]
MSDLFADLRASSAPTKSTPQQTNKKIGPTTPQRRQQHDAFSIISASQPSSRPITNDQLNDRQGRQAHGADFTWRSAFSALFTSSLDGAAASRNPNQVNMTMAERAILAHKARVAQNNARVGPARAPFRFGMDLSLWRDRQPRIK